MKGLHLLLDEVESKGEKVPKQKEDSKREKTNLHTEYQEWYSKALPAIRQLLPERYKEFQELYRLEKRKDITASTYTIADYLGGITITRGIYKEEVVNPLACFVSKFQLQITIVQSASERIDSLLVNIEGVLQAELFDHELDSAKELFKKKHYRASGALAGVTLETHLSKVVQNHNIKPNKKSPSIADYNEALKKQSIIEVPDWRLIQRLADIRNLCVHAKGRDPKPEEVDDIINGVNKVIKTIY